MSAGMLVKKMCGKAGTSEPSSESEDEVPGPIKGAPPKVKTPEEEAKQRAKKERKRVRKSLRQSLGREPTDDEVKAQIERALNAPMAKAKAGPKRPASEMGEKPATMRTWRASAAASSSSGDVVMLDPASSQASGSADPRPGGGDATKLDPASSQASGVADPRLVSVENSDDEGGDAPKNRLDCTNAEECGHYGLKWSEFLLVDPEASWSGKIWGWCQECSGLDKKAFVREAKRMKRARVALKQEHHFRSRNMTFNNQLEFIRRMFPGATNTQAFELAVKRMLTLTVTFNAAYDKMNVHQQEVAAKIAQTWLDDVKKCAEDPSYACRTDAQTLTSWEASYLTKVMDGIWWSYVCRRKGCHFFGQNNPLTWIKHKSHYWWRCPMCAIQYQPWAGTQVTDVKRVLTVFDPLTGEAKYIGTSHPPSEDERWLNNMIELEARKIESQADVDAWMNKSALDLNQLIKNEELQAGKIWREMPYSTANHQAHMTSDWDQSPMLERGYVLGSILSEEEASKTPFSDWNGLISVMANHVAACRAKQRASSL